MNKRDKLLLRSSVWRYLLMGVAALLVVIAFYPQVAYAATITVNTTTDEFNTGSGCSLREAIQAANTDAAFSGCSAGSGADTITLPTGTYTLNHTGQNEDNNNTGDLDIVRSITINGADQATTIIDGNNTDAIIDTFFAGAITVNLNTLTLQHGNPTGASFAGGGAIYVKNSVTLNLTAVSLLNNTADSSGGAIYNEGTLTVNNSTLSGNQANRLGGAIYNLGVTSSSSTINNSILSNNIAEYGGAIYTSSNNGINLTINNSTLSGNSAVDRPGGPAGDFGGGGAIYAPTDSLLNIANSTLSGNAAAQNGAAILLVDTNTSGVGTINLKNVTIANNIANNDNNSGGDGGGVYVTSGTVNVQNSIIATNSDNGGTNNYPDVAGTFADQGNNLIGKNNGSNFAPGTLVGTIASPVNPQLGALANNGGSTLTQALLAASPALNAGNNTACAAAPVNNLDQRGVARPQGTICDIGAFEAKGLNTSVTQQSPNAAAYDPTPTSCGANSYPSQTVTPLLHNNTGTTFTGIFFKVKTLEYKVAQAGGVQPLLCNADTPGGGVGAILTTGNSLPANGDLSQAFVIGLPVRAGYRFFVDVYSNNAVAATGNNEGDYLGSLVYEFDANGNPVGINQTIFLPLVTR